MAYAQSYIRSSTGRSYIGLSTDWKPHLGRQPDGSTVTASELPKGSTFTELDTARTQVFDGVEWRYLPTPAANDVVGKLNEVLAVLTEMHETQKEIAMALAVATA